LAGRAKTPKKERKVDHHPPELAEGQINAGKEKYEAVHHSILS
jgi:hypothetical protein